jgi:putative transposase
MSTPLYKNAIITNGTETLRVVTADLERNRAVVISLTAPTAQLRKVDDLQELSGYTAYIPTPGKHQEISAAQRAVCDKAWNAIEPMVLGANVYKLCDPTYRAAAAREAAQNAGVSEKTIYKHFRRYFQRGQDRLALLANFMRCGARELPGTAKRGRKSRHYVTFQLAPQDKEYMHRITDKYYKRENRRSIHETFLNLLNDHYSYLDGNNELQPKPIGQRPSERQFRYFLKDEFEPGQLLASRVGAKEYGRNHRAKLSTAVKRCLGVGHQYDIDATIVDLYAVFEGDRKKIIGRLTLYLIIDRKSRLIVGFHLGLEHASYMAAVEAIASISEDKQQLCEELGVPYDPNDWPADQVFPQEFIADRAELLSKAASAISDRMTINVGFTEACRPDYKPFAENGFKLLRVTLQAEVPAFDPPENARKRRKKAYEKDACLIVREIKAAILRHIIALNRAPVDRSLLLSTRQVLKGQEPSPIALWNEGYPKQMGQLSRFSADEARRRLWPIGDASLTVHGLQFRKCVYVCNDPRFAAWAANARRTGAQNVSVLYTRAVVDRVYLQVPRTGELLEAVLSDRNPDGYKGLSFAEVDALERIRRGDWVRTHGQTRMKTQLDRLNGTAAITAQPMKEHKELGPMSREVRRAHTKPDRDIELKKERERTGRITDAERAMSEPAKPGAYMNQVAEDVAQPAEAGTSCDEAKQSSTAIAVRHFYSEMRITK